jgi:transcriptional regulator with XRE-family HTH domain
VTRYAEAGQRLRNLRLRRGLSLAVVSGLAGKSKPWLSAIENGHLQLVRYTDVARLAAVLGVATDDVARAAGLLDGDGHSVGRHG